MKLTLPQKDIYFEQLLFPGEPIYSIGARITIEGRIDPEILGQAYHELIRQHDAYRIILGREGEDVRMFIATEHDSSLQFIDLSDVANAGEVADRYMSSAFLEAFDLLDGRLLHKFTLLKIREDLFHLFSVYHHIITDGWGTSLMFQRLVCNYNELAQYGEIRTDYPFSYSEFAKEDDVYSHSAQFQADKVYWKEKYKLLPENLFTKLDPGLILNKSSREELFLKRELYNQLIRFASSQKATVFQVILSAIYTYFGRKHQITDFSIGLPVLNRSNARFKKTVGLFMGLTPLRVSFSMEDTIGELITRIKEQLKQDYRHQRFPLGHLVKELSVFNEKERIFNITLSYEKQDYSAHFLGTRTTVTPMTHGSERVALAIYIREFDATEDVKIDFDYNLNYFTKESIVAVVRHFQVLLQNLPQDPSKKIHELTYLTPNEIDQLTIHFNDTCSAFPADKTIVDLFEEQVEKMPDNIAIMDNDSRISYSQVKQMAEHIACRLAEESGTTDETRSACNDPVGVIVSRSARLVPLLLGILRAGRSFIPIDPSLPEQRIQHIITNSRVKIIITDYRNAEEEGLKYITLERIFGPTAGGKGLLRSRPQPGDTAYIIYTSGSTGTPKGVEIGHRSLTNFLYSILEKPGITSQDLLYAVTTYSFDISILEFFAPLAAGATLFIAASETLAEPQEVIAGIERVGPSILQATPSFYQMLFAAGWKGGSKIKILCGGDLLSEALAGRLLQTSREIWNLYGPTETTIWSSTRKIEAPEDASIIGRPIHNTSFYIVDAHLKLLPVGTAGRIFIGGAGLAKGYYQNTGLTRLKFIENPYLPGQRIYDTGDVGKWNATGEIEFLGRNDSQVKIRGYRIELGEIESHINSCLGIDDAVVLDVKRGIQENILVAYIPGTSHNGKDFEHIRMFLKEHLPEYMIPGLFVEIERLPYTHNNKVDRQRLRSNLPQLPDKPSPLMEHLSPTEATLAATWQNILDVTRPVAGNDSFFSLGGHSILAVRLIAEISAAFSIQLPLRSVFEHHTLGKMAAYIDSRKGSDNSPKIEKAPVRKWYPLTPNQFRIWLACQQAGSFSLYNMFAAYRVIGDPDKDQLASAIKKLIGRYEILRTFIVEVDGIPCQKINEPSDMAFLLAVHAADNEEAAARTMTAFSGYEFDPGGDILLKVGMIEKTGGERVLLFLTHHIIMDGISLNLLAGELTQAYNTEYDKIGPDGIQFRDYSEWLNHRQRMTQDDNNQFWKSVLDGYSKQELFTSGRLSGQSGRKSTFKIGGIAFIKLKQMASDNGTSLFSALLSAFIGFAHKYSALTDICIGLITSGRDQQELMNIMGMMTHTFPFRIKVNGQWTFLQLLQNVSSGLTDIYQHPFLPEDVQPGKLFDVVITHQSQAFQVNRTIAISDRLSLYPVAQENIIARFPLVFNFYEDKDSLLCELDHNQQAYSSLQIDIITKKFIRFVEGVTKDAGQRIADHSLLLEEEINRKENIDITFNF